MFAELMTIVSSHPFDDVGEEFIQTNQNQIFNRLKMCEANLDRTAHLIITITIVTIITICFIITIFSTIVITTPAYLDRTVHVVHKCNWGKKDGQLHLFYLSRSAKSCKLQKKKCKKYLWHKLLECHIEAILCLPRLGPSSSLPSRWLYPSNGQHSRSEHFQ